MAARAVYIGINKIMEAFEKKADTPFFSLWVGKTRAEQNKDNDFEKASEKLENQIKDFELEDFTDTFIIALHPEKKANYTVSDMKEATLMYCSIKKNDQPKPYALGANNYNYEILQTLNEIKNNQNALESRLNAIEGEDVEEEETETVGSTEEVLIDKISGIVNSPLVGLLMNFFNRPNQVNALAGISTENDLEQILEVLFSKGVTVNHLKKLSEYPKSKIDMLLTML